jgi:hypothetical protein
LRKYTEREGRKEGRREERRKVGSEGRREIKLNVEK